MTTQMPAKQVVVVAAYNEATNLEHLVPALLRLPGAPTVVIVDDNSPDGTPALLERLAAAEPRLVPLVQPGKLGYGTAVLAGFRRALELGADAVATLDADFSHDPADVPRLFAALADADVAVGSRYVGGIRIINWHISRLFLSLFANRYVKTILGLRLEDATSGFRAYRRGALEALETETIRSQGYSFLVEVLYRLHRRGLRLTEVPIIYSERREGQSKMSRKVILEAMVRPWLLRLGGLRGGHRAAPPR